MEKLIAYYDQIDLLTNSNYSLKGYNISKAGYLEKDGIDTSYFIIRDTHSGYQLELKH